MRLRASDSAEHRWLSGRMSFERNSASVRASFLSVFFVERLTTLNLRVFTTMTLKPLLAIRSRKKRELAVLSIAMIMSSWVSDDDRCLISEMKARYPSLFISNLVPSSRTETDVSMQIVN